MGFLFNIDNGGTLTDILVVDGRDIHFKSEDNRRLLDDLVGTRVHTIDLGLSGAEF
jgi:N-methylhydantoinase A/oxoprolinase/acetone carboxylase beta subunit